MTKRQREIARHMLGLKEGNRKSYRNRFYATDGHADYGDLVEMLKVGFVTTHGNGSSRTWHLTRAAAESVLLPGESLDAEDFPA